jgi:phage terminase Nu1 subunit (DNA packaging protein)
LISGTSTQIELAKLFGLTSERVGQLAKAGEIKKQRGGKFAPSAITAYIQFLRDRSRKGTDYAELLDAERYRQRKRENDLAEDLVAPVSLLSDALENAASQIVPILESLPLHMKRQFPEITGDQIQLVKTAIAECRNVIADIEIET